MKRLFSILLSLTLGACAAQPRVMFWYGSEQQPVTDTSWLGDPEWNGQTRIRGADARDFEITLAVVPGPMLRLESTSNRVYWHVGGKLMDAPQPVDPERTYLLATIRPLGRPPRLSSCTVVVIGGPLTGRAVRIKPPEWVDHGDQPSLAVFEVPATVQLNPGYVPFRIVDFAGK